MIEQDDTVRIDYLDFKNDPISPCDLGYATKITEYDANGNIILESYYDVYGSETKCTAGYYGRVTFFNNYTKVYSEYFVDNMQRRCSSINGYSRIDRYLDSNGRIEKECYYDEKDSPISSNIGCFGIKYEYNRDKIKKVFINKNDQIVLNILGYAEEVSYINENGSICTEKYYDVDGNPVALSKGQYGIKHVGNKSFYLNKNGKIYFQLENFFSNFPWMVIIFGMILSLAMSFLPGKPQRILLSLYIVFILYETIAFRESGRINLTPFWSYRQFFKNYSLRLEILNNIWLFLPFGAGLYSIFKKKWIILILFLFSIGIEVSQHIFGLGLCEIDDVISNTLGGAIGMIMVASLLDITKINSC